MLQEILGCCSQRGMVQPRIVVAYSYYTTLIALTSNCVADCCADGSSDSRSAMQMVLLQFVLLQYCRLGCQTVGRLLQLGLNHNDGVC